MIHFVVGVVTLLLSSFPVFAAPAALEGCGSVHDCTKCHAMTTKEAGELLSFSGVNVKSVKPAPSHGLYEVLFEKDGGSGIVFIDFGKKRLIQGVMVDLKTRQPVAAHENEMQRPKQVSAIDPQKIPAQHAVVMGNPKGLKKIYVFTDPDCPFCRQLHPILHQLEKQAPDIAINIMMYPLRQLHPQAYDKSRVVVARKTRDLLDKAFEGKELPKPKGNEGKAAIDAIIAFAGEHGIHGTPMILLTDGSVYQGPRDAESIKKAAEAK